MIHTCPYCNIKVIYREDNACSICGKNVFDEIVKKIPVIVIMLYVTYGIILFGICIQYIINISADSLFNKTLSSLLFPLFKQYNIPLIGISTVILGIVLTALKSSRIYSIIFFTIITINLGSFFSYAIITDILAFEYYIFFTPTVLYFLIFSITLIKSKKLKEYFSSK